MANSPRIGSIYDVKESIRDAVDIAHDHMDEVDEHFERDDPDTNNTLASISREITHGYLNLPMRAYWMGREACAAGKDIYHEARERFGRKKN